MLDDHDEFLDEVIEQVTKNNNLKKSKAIRRETEKATVESLMARTNLSRKEIEKILEDTRKSKLLEQRRTAAKKRTSRSFFQFFLRNKILIMSLGIAIPISYFVVNLSIDIINSTSNPIIVNHVLTQQEPQDKTNVLKLEQPNNSISTNRKNTDLIRAIKSNSFRTVNSLISEGGSLYLQGNDKSYNDPFYMTVEYADRAILVTLLEAGLNPLRNMEIYNNTIKLIYTDKTNENESINKLIFPYIVNKDSTPESIKALWKLNIPYNYYEAVRAIKSNNVEALNLFHQANKGEYQQNWLELGLLNELISSNFQQSKVIKYLNKLLFDGTLHNVKKIALAGDATI